MGRLGRIADFLGLKRNATILLVALLLAGTAEKLWIDFAPKLLENFGATILIIGLFDALQTGLGAVYNYPGGWITDRWGERRSLLLFNGLSLIGYIIVWLWPSWPVMLGCTFLFVAWSALALPATFSVVATTLHASKHTMGIGVQSTVRRIPKIIGQLVGGWLMTRYGWEQGLHYALLLCIILSGLTSVFQFFMLENNPKHGDTKHDETKTISFLGVVRTFTPALRELLVSDILIRFCERIPYAFVILWAMNHGGLTAQQFGWLVSIEMVTAMICYIPVAHLADKYGRRPFVLVTFVFFTLFPVTLIWANSFGWLALAFAVRGLKEFGEPARKALIIGEAVPEMRARTYGAYYLIRDCVVTSGSFLGAWLWSIHPHANFVGAAICGLLGTIWFWWFIYLRPIPLVVPPSGGSGTA